MLMIRGTSVMTDDTLQDPGTKLQAEIFLFITVSRPLLRLMQPLSQWVPVPLKWPQHDRNYLPSSSAEG